MSWLLESRCLTLAGCVSYSYYKQIVIGPLPSAEDERQTVVLHMGTALLLPGWKKNSLFTCSEPNESSWKGHGCFDVPNTGVYNRSSTDY